MATISIVLDSSEGKLNVVGTTEESPVRLENRVFINSVGSQPPNFQDVQFIHTGDNYSVQGIYDHFFNFIKRKNLIDYKITMGVKR
jgi:hypothetical protein